MGLKHQKVVLITSGQPSLNPRLVKEADALVEAGYNVTVIYQYWNDWATKLDQKLLAQKKWQTIKVGGDPDTEKIKYWKTRIRLKINQKLVNSLGFKFGLAEKSIGRCTFALAREAEKINANLYIAHNLGALPATVLAAKKNNAKCGFDAEDFHRYEISSDPTNPDVKIRKYMEDRYFPKLDYLSTASPLITKAYSELYPSLVPKTLLNVFPKKQIELVVSDKSKIQLFWFSQTVSHSRGLEDIIIAMGISKSNNLELHLLGDCKSSTQKSFNDLAVENRVPLEKIHFHSPIAPDEIFNFAAKFDIGLAAEIGEPRNRDICLTNKIFTYVQSGLAILASDTSAQKDFLEENPNLGFVYLKNNPENLAKYFDKYAENINLLMEHRTNSLLIGQNTLNWEMESQKFLKIIHSLLG